MHVEQYPRFIEILKDFQYLIKRRQSKLLWRRDSELEPELYDLSFQPALKSSTVERVFQSDLCTRCQRRISYKKEQFTEEVPSLPYMILVQNTFIGEESGYYQDPAVDEMFRKIISSVLKHSVEEFLVREVLRCHFGAEEASDQRWVANCKSHIEDDIQKFNLKGILIIGQAAPLLFPEKEELKNLIGQVNQFMGIPMVVTPGPTRLVYMQRNNFSKDKIVTEKKKIFNAVQLFQNSVMT